MANPFYVGLPPKFSDMKKFFLTIILAIGLLFKSFADEGMWLPLLLRQQVYNDMEKKGLKLMKQDFAIK